MAKKKNEIPEEIDAELKSPKFGKPKTHTASGYILDINAQRFFAIKHSLEISGPNTASS